MREITLLSQKNLRLAINRLSLSLNYEEARRPAIAISSAPLLVRDSGEDRGEAGDGGVGVVGQPTKHISSGSDRELDESLSQTQSHGGLGGGRGEVSHQANEA